MELTDLLDAFDRTSANVTKLEAVLERAQPYMPSMGSVSKSDAEYDDLARAWADLLEGLRPIDGWTVTAGLPDIDELSQTFIQWMELGEPAPFSLYDDVEQPARELTEYKYRLNKARRRAARERLRALVDQIDAGLPVLLKGVARDSQEVLRDDLADDLRDAVAEIERLMADTTSRQGRWSDLHRHLRFGEGHDWHDIREIDWPSVKVDVETGTLADVDPLPVPQIDLGEAARGHLTGVAHTALPWDQLSADDFERLLYNLLQDIPEHQNVQWLMQTRAPDRGRDLSLDRVMHDGSGGVRNERVIVQAKHWLSKSVGPAEIQDALARVKLWRPVVRALLVVTSGRFTTDAVAFAEQHNETGDAPFIDLWSESKLETLLAQRPGIAAAHGLR